MMRRSAVVVGTIGLALLGRPLCSPSAVAAAASVRLKNGAPSVDNLVDQFMQALKERDKAKLHDLRVTEDEYRGLILPGSVDEGKPRQHYNEQASKYFWSILDTKSIYSEANILHAWGGRPLKLKSVAYRGGTKKYADYTAYKHLELKLEDETGNEDELRIGSIAEVDGVYKFISYIQK